MFRLLTILLIALGPSQSSANPTLRLTRLTFLASAPPACTDGVDAAGQPCLEAED